MKRFRYIRRWLILMFLMCFNAFPSSIIDTSKYLAPHFPEYGYDLYKIGVDTSRQYFINGADFFYNNGDTANYIRCLMGMSDIEKRHGRFNRAFEILSDIQKNYIQRSDLDGQIDLNIRFGRLYGFYGLDSLALKSHKNALEISRVHTYYKGSTSAYFSVAEQLTKMEAYDDAIKYLDSCYLTGKGDVRHIYVDAMYAYAYLKKKEYRKAEIYLKGLIPIFKERELGFLAKVYGYHAELKKAKKETDSAIFYYEEALRTTDALKQHFEIKPELLEELSYLYRKAGNTEQAYKYMIQHKEITDSLFNLQSAQNKELFEIKNEYREDLSKKEEQIAAQLKLIALSKQASFRLKLVFGVMLLLIGIGLFTFWQRFQMRKLVSDKKQNDALIEVKNKELTSKALQFIEKEHAFNELLAYVKENAPEKYKSFNYKSKQSNKRIWDDFHLRFTQTNSKFYEKLRELHPDLTQTDLKHCALVKLNFDSKEMSIILGISLHGVHTARSRIRKKIGLKREDSLSGYLAGVN